MPRYRFTGSFETVLHGLAHGVNAVLHRADDGGESAEHGQPDGSTVVARPGDEVETDETYPHAQLVNVETGEPDDPGPEGGDGAEALAAGLREVEAAGTRGAATASTVITAAAAASKPDKPNTTPPAGPPPATETDPTIDPADSSSPPADPEAQV